jgi:hypothetical protein
VHARRHPRELSSTGITKLGNSAAPARVKRHMIAEASFCPCLAHQPSHQVDVVRCKVEKHSPTGSAAALPGRHLIG